MSEDAERGEGGPRPQIRPASLIEEPPGRYGREARDRRAEARDPSSDGARAALESFYHAFNQRSLDVFDDVWAPDDMISVYNPLGGITRGLRDIHALYQRIFESHARVWVELHDIIEYIATGTAVFAGRELGNFSRGATTVPLAIRTSRIFQYFGPDTGWRQVHHHGSIDDAAALSRYQHAVAGDASGS